MYVLLSDATSAPTGNPFATIVSFSVVSARRTWAPSYTRLKIWDA